MSRLPRAVEGGKAAANNSAFSVNVRRDVKPCAAGEAKMSDPFDRLLLHPTPAQLADALDQASGNAPSTESARRWRPILDEYATTADGRSQLEHISYGPGGVRFLSVAWWADHQGRKLVRVCGGLSQRGHQRHYSRMDRDLRPPLWHVGPERVYRVRRPGGEPEWLACCACGEVGPPARLAWMSQRCGGCHDRREEGAALEEGITICDLPRSIYGLAYAPDGRRLAVSSGDQVLEVLELEAGEADDLFRGDNCAGWEELRSVAWSPDGRWIAAVDPREEVIRLWDWSEEGVSEAEPLDTLNDEGGGRSVGLAFSPDGAYLAAGYTDGRVLLYRREGGWPTVGEWFTARGMHAPVASLCFSPDGKSLVLGRRHGQVTILDVATGRRVDQISVSGAGEDVGFVEATPDGERLVLLTAPGEEGLDGLSTMPERAILRLLSFATRGELHAHVLLPPSLIALSPNGRHLAWVIHHTGRSPAEVVFWDVAEWRGAGALEWDCEDTITALAFSPGGEEIATGSQGGAVKLWPWRRLLGV
jgi:dipeptidyl aminopeptidase/acylaminoacyl peptidase